MRVLAIDPAIRNTGYAVIEGDHRSAKVITYEVIRIPKAIPQSAALAAVRTHLAKEKLAVEPRLKRWQDLFLTLKAIEQDL